MKSLQTPVNRRYFFYFALTTVAAPLLYAPPPALAAALQDAPASGKYQYGATAGEFQWQFDWTKPQPLITKFWVNIRSQASDSQLFKANRDVSVQTVLEQAGLVELPYPQIQFEPVITAPISGQPALRNVLGRKLIAARLFPWSAPKNTFFRMGSDGWSFTHNDQVIAPPPRSGVDISTYRVGPNQDIGFGLAPGMFAWFIPEELFAGIKIPARPKTVSIMQ